MEEAAAPQILIQRTIRRISSLSHLRVNILQYRHGDAKNEANVVHQMGDIFQQASLRNTVTSADLQLPNHAAAAFGGARQPTFMMHHSDWHWAGSNQPFEG